MLFCKYYFGSLLESFDEGCGGKVQKTWGKSTDVAVYYKDVHSPETENAYTKMLNNFRTKWDPVFEDYYLIQIFQALKGGI